MQISKTDKDFSTKSYLEDIKFPIKFRDIHKIQKKLYQYQRFCYKVSKKLLIYASKILLGIRI